MEIPYDDTICCNCFCELPEEDTDPENSGTSPWWDGYCSEACRQGVPVPTDQEMLAKLDAYGHLNYVVGFSDKCSDDDICDCPTIWAPGKPKQAPTYNEEGACTKCGGRENRGDWLACFDFRVWRHPSRGVLVAYHAVINSDSGGFIDTLESGVVEAENAPFGLPECYCIDCGAPLWTEEECKSADECQERWERDLKEEVEGC